MTDRVPWAMRAGVLVLVATLLFVGVSAWEPWPISSFRLYSRIKGPTAGSLFAFRVAPSGSEHRIDYERLPHAYFEAKYLVEKLGRVSDREREALCEALADAERAEGRRTASIRIYWERYEVRLVDGERDKRRIERELRWSCAESGS